MKKEQRTEERKTEQMYKEIENGRTKEKIGIPKKGAKIETILKTWLLL
jgi:hypothetical protein